MTIYIDIVLIENLIMNYIILFTTAVVLKIKVNHIRLILASLLGAGYSIIAYMGIIKVYSSIILKIILSVLIIYIAFNPQNIKKMCKTIKGYGEAKKIISEFKPDIVIGTGGYICGATISSAHNLKIPTLLHESNAFPGMAIKMLANKTNTILVSFRDAIPRIKNCKNVVFTGTPVKIKKKDFNKMKEKK